MDKRKQGRPAPHNIINALKKLIVCQVFYNNIAKPYSLQEQIKSSPETLQEILNLTLGELITEPAVALDESACPKKQKKKPNQTEVFLEWYQVSQGQHQQAQT